MKKIIKIVTLLVVMASAPMVSMAAYNDVTLTTDVVITVAGVNLNVSGSSAVVGSVVVSSGSFDVTLLSGSSFVVISSDRKDFTLSTTGTGATSAIECGSSTSTLTLSSTGTSVVTVTPNGTCTTTTTATSVPIVVGNGPIVGNYTLPSNTPPPRLQIVYPDGRIEYLDESATSTTLGVGATTASSVSVYARTLSLGKEGKDVEALQTFLESRGFLVMPKGVAKGYFGNVTKNALIKYQKSVGIDPIGIFGPMTRAFIEKLNPGAVGTQAPSPTGSLGSGSVKTFSYTRSLSVGKSGVDVEALQMFLEGKGFLVIPPGIAKGYFGDITKEALIKYQKSVGIDPIGIFGPMTRARVGAEE